MNNKKQITLNIATNYASSVVGVVLGFLIPPLALSYWNTDRYGIWILVTSLVAYLSTSGLGIDTAAAVLMAKAPKTRDKNTIFSTSLLLLILSSVVFFLFFLLMNAYFPQWIEVFGKIPSDLVSDSRQAITIFVVAFFLNYPFTIISAGLVGYQRQYLDNIFRTLVSLTALASLLCVMASHGSLRDFALTQSIFTLLTNFVKLAVYWFGVRKKTVDSTAETAPMGRLSETRPQHIIKSGLNYFVYGLSILLVTNIDIFIISNFLSLASVTAYSVTSKVLWMLNTVVTLLIASMAPVVSKEFGVANYPWLSEAYRTLSKLALFFGGLLCLGSVLFLDDFIRHVWVGPTGSVGDLVVLSLGAYSLLMIVTNVSNIFLMQGNLLRGFIFVGWTDAILHVVFVLLLIPPLGVLGVALGQCLATALSQAWLSPRLLRKNTANRLKFDQRPLVRLVGYVLLPGLVAGLVTHWLTADLFLRLVAGVILVFLYVVGSYLVFFGKESPVELYGILKAKLRTV